MNKQAVKEIEILGEIASQLIYRSKSLRYSIEGGDDLTENLNQIAAALHYEIEILKHKVMNSKEHYARRSGTTPDVLKKQLNRIIKLGESAHKEATKESKKKRLKDEVVRTPKVLNRLPYYSEQDIEFSMPIYKAEHRFPLLVLKRLDPDENIHNSEQRLLILDNDGDLAVIKVPFKMMIQAEERLEKWVGKSDTKACIIIARNSKGFDINFLMISQPQRKALDTMAKRFEETGSRQQPVTAVARKVLARARDMAVIIPE